MPGDCLKSASLAFLQLFCDAVYQEEIGYQYSSVNASSFNLLVNPLYGHHFLLFYREHWQNTML